MKVKDVDNLFFNLDGFDYRVIAGFYDKDGYYIGQINRNYMSGECFMSGELRVFWKNKIKFLRMYTVRDTVMFAFIVLKGEEK